MYLQQLSRRGTDQQHQLPGAFLPHELGGAQSCLETLRCLPAFLFLVLKPSLIYKDSGDRKGEKEEEKRRRRKEETEEKNDREREKRKTFAFNFLVFLTA